MSTWATTSNNFFNRTVVPLFLVVVCPPFAMLMWHTNFNLDGSFLNLWAELREKGLFQLIIEVWKPLFFGSKAAWTMIGIFAALQLAGKKLALKLEHRIRAEWILGAIGGLYGGISGVWGPPLLVYLLSIGADKLETVRVQGVVFLIGAAVLLSAHLHSGVMNAQSIWFSAALVPPAFLGQSIGFAIQDRLDQAKFRRWTQVLLVVTGLNLMRRAVGL